MNTGFLERRRLREASRELTRLLVLGYGVSLILLFTGAYRYYTVVGSSHLLWKTVMLIGGLTLALTLAVPHLWRGPERLLHRFGNLLGVYLMKLTLTVVYVALIWPVGSILRAVRGRHPIYEWAEDGLSSDMEGWHDKALPSDLATPGKLGGRRRIGLLMVLAFFSRRGYVIFLPLLLILVSLGIALFFLQTSALAPFIYTLF